MNATAWNYFVPFETDISVALERLREDVFARGDYRYSNGADMTQIETAALALAAPTGTGSSGEHGQEFLPSFTALETSLKPGSIRQLLDQRGRAGTHSILDITSLFPRPRLGAISPFPRSKSFELFGTDTPGRDEIEEAWSLGRI